MTKISEIQSAGHGVVFVQLFHNSNESDAFVRERAMIDAIMGLKQLTNKIRGRKKNTKIMGWTDNPIKKLGCYLLYRAMHKYLCDGERQFYFEMK